MKIVIWLGVATLLFLLLVPTRRRAKEPFDWTKRRRWQRWRRWRARGAFPHDR